MVTSITRIGLPTSCTPENRTVAVNTADVLVGWEWYRNERIHARKVALKEQGRRARRGPGGRLSDAVDPPSDIGSGGGGGATSGERKMAVEESPRGVQSAAAAIEEPRKRKLRYAPC